MATIGYNSCLWGAPPLSSIAVSANSTMLINADGEEIAFKYIPQSTSPITHVNLYLNIEGTVTDINFKIRVESDNADAPSTTVLGAATAEFAGLAADGMAGEKALVTNTGNLTVNVPVWVILYRTSGSSLSGTNYVGFGGNGSASPLDGAAYMRLYTSGSWTGTAISGTRLGYVIKHADNSYVGVPQKNSIASSASVGLLSGTTRHGIRVKYGAQVKFPGILLNIRKTGSPNALIVTVYEGSVSKYSQTIPAASIVSLVWFPYWFSSPALLAADADLYIVLKQESDGGDGSNYYDLYTWTYDDGYLPANQPADTAFVYGTGDDPTTLTASTTEFPMLVPLLGDTATDLDQAAGGGGLIGGHQYIGMGR